MSQSYYWILNGPGIITSRTASGVDIEWKAPDETDPRIHIGKQANNVMYWAQSPADVRAFCERNPSLVAVRSETYGAISCAEFIGHISGLRDNVQSIGEWFS